MSKASFMAHTLKLGNPKPDMQPAWDTRGGEEFSEGGETF